MPVLDTQALIQNRVAAIRDFSEGIFPTRDGVSRPIVAEIDVSGGVDSAVLVGLLAKAVGPTRMVAVYQGIHSSDASRDQAQEVCAAFGVQLVEVDLTDIYSDLIKTMKAALVKAYGDTLTAEELEQRLAQDPTILGSIRSTVRAPVGRGFNRIMGGGIRYGTGNECEDRWTRFFQKGGDGEVDCNPIAMLSKGEVYQLALALGVPTSIITARPTPDLWGTGDAHTDEDEFGNYFGFNGPDYGQTFYSYIDAETGAYSRVGLIERTARWLDEPCDETCTFGELWFDRGLSTADQREVLDRATDGASAALAGLDGALIEKLLLAARRIESMTRHKMNPNCPTLGERHELLAKNILTDTLPEV
jgi:NAD+ synthetase